MECTIDEMKEILASVGVRTNANWKKETIENKFYDLQAAGRIRFGIEPEGNPEPEPERRSKPLNSFQEEYLIVLGMADPKKGDKDELVIDFCRNNLSESDFKARYKDRTGYNLLGTPEEKS